MLHLANAEILYIADSVAKEKGLSKDVIVEAMEQAIEIAARKKYGNEHNISATIDRKTGEVYLAKSMKIVENIQDYATEILLIDALLINPDAKLNESVKIELPPIDLGRVSAIAAKQAVIDKIHDAERDLQYEDFKYRKGEVITGTVKTILSREIIVDL
jgi:N utilization substance protein A